MKRLILLLIIWYLFFMYATHKSNAYTVNDITTDYINLATTDIHSLTIPTGKDFILKGICVVEEGNKGLDIILADNGNTMLYLNKWGFNSLIELPFKNRFDIINSSPDGLKISFSGYFIDEGEELGGQVVNVTTWTGTVIEDTKDFLSSTDSYEIFSLLFIWLIVFVLLLATIKHGFRIGVKLSYKLLWKI